MSTPYPKAYRPDWAKYNLPLRVDAVIELIHKGTGGNKKDKTPREQAYSLVKRHLQDLQRRDYTTTVTTEQAYQLLCNAAEVAGWYARTGQDTTE